MDTTKEAQAQGQQAGEQQDQQMQTVPQSGQQSDQQAGQQQGALARRANTGVLKPPVDVIEDMYGITLIADMPGVSKENLNLRLEAQSLTIEGAISLDLPPEMDSRHAEVRHQHYERTFALSRDLDGEQAEAELKHGVLRVRIPKTQQAAPRRIPVNAAQA